MAFLASSSFQGQPGLSRFKGRSGPDLVPKATLAYHRLKGRPGLSPLKGPPWPIIAFVRFSLEPFRDPFEPHLDQARCDGITRSRQGT